VYGPTVRRKSGTGLVRNELKALAAALRLAVEGRSRLYGYELFARLAAWEGRSPMNHGTLYRCLRSLERLGYLRVDVEPSGDAPGPPRVYYMLTESGMLEARRSTLLLAAEKNPLAWVDPADAISPAGKPGGNRSPA
jgi:DNA-binding PadR family transcriptional regulator